MSSDVSLAPSRVSEFADESRAARALLRGCDKRFSGATQLVELCRDEEKILYRAIEGDLRCLITIAVRPAALVLERFAHEYSMRDALDNSWAIVPGGWYESGLGVLLQTSDPGGVLLSEFRTRPIERLPQIVDIVAHAISVARALGSAHDAGIVHGDLKPENILLTPAGGARLLGFGISQLVSDGGATPEGEGPIRGSLAYLAPERAKRTRAGIDARADLYSFGIVLYELLTGRLPFYAADVAGWVHCHLARRPIPPGELRPQIPRALSRLVVKLLAKEPADRYQDADSVARALESALDHDESAEDHDSPASESARQVPQFSQHLYGRESELRSLRLTHERVAQHGGSAFVLIGGLSGSGKSFLVRQFERALLGCGALFVSGKYDQYLRDIPYQTLSQCFDRLIQDIISSEPDTQARWRESLVAALGDNSELMVKLVPSLATLIGDPAQTTSIGPQEDQIRFRATLKRFLQVFATADHPLTLFLDDIQWLDDATFGFLRELSEAEDVSHLLVIAAYREEEATSSAALASTLASLRASPTEVVEIKLTSLSDRSLMSMVADGLGRSESDVMPLVELVRQKTAGLPFLAVQLLGSLIERELILFNSTEQRWEWELKRITQTLCDDDAVDYLIEKIKSLSPQSREDLFYLACLGNRSTLQTVASVLELRADAVQARLTEAASAGLILLQDGICSFAHDRVQESVYGGGGLGARASAHLATARRLLAHAGQSSLHEAAYEIATQFLKALPLHPPEAEMFAAARVFEVAGERAKAASAYDAALMFFDAGEKLVASEKAVVGDLRKLGFGLRRNLAECRFLTGKLEAAETDLLALQGCAQTIEEAADVAWLLITLYTARDSSDLAIRTCLEFLEVAGAPLRRDATLEQIETEYRNLQCLIGPSSIEGLLALEPMNDSRQIAILNVLTAALPPAFFSDERLVCQILCRMAMISVRFGNSDASPLGYAYLGMVAGPVFNDYAAAYRFGRLGLNLVEKKPELARYKARVYMTFAYHVAPWTKPLEDHRGLLKQAFEAAVLAGDLTYAGFSSCTFISAMIASGEPLIDIEREAAVKLAHVRNAKFGLIVDIITAQRQMVQALRGETLSLGNFSTQDFSESAFEHHLASNRSLDIAACWYWIRRLQLHVYAGDYRQALVAAARAEPLLWTTAGHLELAEYHFFAGIAHAGGLNMGMDHGDPEALSRHVIQFSKWGQNAPANFSARDALLRAEVARVEGQTFNAIKQFDRAMALAAEHSRLHDEALAYERAADFYLSSDTPTMGALLVTEAARRYERWGARGKVAALAVAFPTVVAEVGSRRVETSAVVSTSAQALDVDAVIQSLQAVSEETSFAKVVQTLMTIALEHANAESGALILPTERGLRCRAYAFASPDNITVEPRDEDVVVSGLPVSVLQAAILGQRTIAIPDARDAHEFGKDPRFSTGEVRSVLCLPLLRQAEVIGALYLESTVVAGAFTPIKTLMLRLLASTAAIAIENASLDEKTLLLKEIHHRVKNNLQLISSLLSLQESAIDDPAVSRLFAQSKDRVRSMALVHENLYRAGNFVRVAMAEHLRTLCARLLRAYRPAGQSVDIEVFVDDVELDINSAISCGLIVNELVSNALKHGFHGSAAGRIVVRLSTDGAQEFVLIVSDNGSGLPTAVRSCAKPSSADDTGGIGMHLVADLAHQLGGSISVSNDSGTSVELRFPRSENNR
ncbi:AAA family ATPase [Cupriavidus agavae]|uniref:Putative ATPase n=1 Tax=Cupriavidus agavae TaxID=1001822 RepID=A0A4V2FGH8_9BURK|nr:AAA family ATPase [Cupriavidus agavae]RZT36829.1 putative ATPase [Cupriavidus agavae]